MNLFARRRKKASQPQRLSQDTESIMAIKRARQLRKEVEAREPMINAHYELMRQELRSNHFVERLSLGMKGT